MRNNQHGEARIETGNIIQGDLDPLRDLPDRFPAGQTKVGRIEAALLPQGSVAGLDNIHELAFPFALVNLAQTRIAGNRQVQAGGDYIGSFPGAFQVAGVNGGKRVAL